MMSICCQSCIVCWAIGSRKNGLWNS